LWNRLSEVASQAGLPLFFPPLEYCTDNSIMIAYAALERLNAKMPFPDGLELDTKPVWSLEDMNH
jgi:N6-L-threonylcarbamoyladenine synthase